MHSPIRDLLYSVFPDKNKYLTYKEGNSPIILSAPHGGNITPLSIPKRKYGNRSRDTYTRRLIQLIIDKLDEKPYYIYSDIHRNRVDLNRDIIEGAQGNKKADQIWMIWNNILRDYSAKVHSLYKRGLYIDIHSHNNSNQFQIGYGLSVKDYLDLKAGWKISSISTLYPLVNKSITEKSLCFGYGSIIDTIEYSGYSVLIPESENKYLNGGRNIQEFSGDEIGAIQIECPIPILKYDLNGVADTLVKSIELFSQRFL